MQEQQEDLLTVWAIPIAEGDCSTNWKDGGQYDKDEKIFWASGACFFVSEKKFLNH